MELRLENLTKVFDEVTAVDHLNLTIQDGKLTGLLGPSGCGKSTLLYMISGLEKPTEGRIFFGDKACLGGFESLHREGMNHQGLLHNGTEEEIKAFTRDVILTFGKRGLLLGADCTVNSDIEHEPIRWVVEAARSI